MTGDRRQALIIANSKYEDEKLSQLSAPEIDAQSLQEVLEDTKVGFFDEVTVLRNQDSQTVREAIEAFFSGRKRGDTLLLYFSGHGVLDPNGRLYLATTNTKTNSLRATGISAQFISESMDASRSKRQILILDCCHSGAFARNSKAAVDRPVGTATAFEGDGTGRVILTATDSTQHAWEGDALLRGDGRSRFTYHLVEGLKTGKADRFGKGRITVDDLYDYVYEQIKDDSPENKPQTPKKWSYNREGELLVAKNLHTYPKEKQPPPRRIGGIVTIGDLRKVLNDVFEEEQIEDIAFDLRLDERSLGQTKSAKIRSLVRQLYQQERLPDLLDWLHRHTKDLFAEVFGERDQVVMEEKSKPLYSKPETKISEVTTPEQLPHKLTETKVELPSQPSPLVAKKLEVLPTEQSISTQIWQQMPLWGWVGIAAIALIVVSALSYSIFDGNNDSELEATQTAAALIAVTGSTTSPIESTPPIGDMQLEDPSLVPSINAMQAFLTKVVSVTSEAELILPYPTDNFDEINPMPMIPESIIAGMPEFTPTPIENFDVPNVENFEWVAVPAGTFWMGASDPEDNPISTELPLHRVYVDAFWISKTEVTNLQYQEFLNANPNYPRPSIVLPPDVDGGSYPIVGISWFDAKAYTDWLSSEIGMEIDLPTEAEWEKAARGEEDIRAYPWGDEFDKNKGNFWSDEDGFAFAAPVGSFPEGASPYGALDMSGNVWEWTSSIYLSYPYHPNDREREDPTNLNPVRVIRGGSWGASFNEGRISDRSYHGTFGVHYNIGFRVVLRPNITVESSVPIQTPTPIPNANINDQEITNNLEPGSYFTYTIQVQEGDLINIYVTSDEDEFDPFVTLYDLDGNPLLENDDLVSKAVSTRAGFEELEIPIDITLIIEIRDVTNEAGGSFTLIIEDLSD